MNRKRKSNLFGMLTLLLLSAACAPQNTTPAIPKGTNSGLDTTKAVLLKSGMFVGLDGPTSGTASIYTQGGMIYILLNPFQSHAGPDLKVYLSKDSTASDYVRIGALQAVMGRQVYAVPGGVIIGNYNYVHVWCEKYSVDFARAAVR